MSVQIKRVYEPYTENDGYRVLVDRLWPRGIAKDKVHIDQWLKEVAPSTGLRQWFHHEELKWHEFELKYRQELKGSEALKELAALAEKHKTLTLVYSAKDEKNNQAVVLRNLIEE
ncbi:MAG TPA: DUF488 domain-containing protein [Mucilaginibacter sp.]|jgi:uncharacterized protein YeaO (DUF488 family)|nr:DUF488 domain-containing protein [Mucilaginibacter sp.]